MKLLATTAAVAIVALNAAAAGDDPNQSLPLSLGQLQTMPLAQTNPLPQTQPVPQLEEISLDGDDYNEDHFEPLFIHEPALSYERDNVTLATYAPIRNMRRCDSNDKVLMNKRRKCVLHSKPIPTNKWWGNLIHVTPMNESHFAPAWAQPYSVALPELPPFGLRVCFPYTYRKLPAPVNGTYVSYSHGVHNDLTLSAQEFMENKPEYNIYSWSEMGSRLQMCDSVSDKCMDSPLLQGMAFVSAKYDGLTPRLDTEFAINHVDNSTPGKFVISLSNSQTWVLYASDKNISLCVESSVKFSVNSSGSSLVAANSYYGTLRIAVLPEGAQDTVYDRFAPCMAIAGSVSMESRTAYSLHWKVVGNTCKSVGLLHFALPHHMNSMAGSFNTLDTPGAIMLHSTTRGLMVGQTLLKWSFVVPEADFKVDFYPAQKLTPWIVNQTDMLGTLQSDIAANWSLNANSWYFNGKLYLKYAWLCLMASDSSVVGQNTTLLTIGLDKLEKIIEPLLNNNLSSPLVYDEVYKGAICSALKNTGQLYDDFGCGIYNDHVYHYGYYIAASAILKFLHPGWSRMAELEDIIWLLLRDIINPSKRDPYFPVFRQFSWFLGHSYSHGVTILDDGKDEESVSEEQLCQYAVLLWGKVTGRKDVEDLGSLLLRLNAQAIGTYFLMTRDNIVHPPQIVRNHVTGICFDNRIYYNTWFLNRVYAIHGIQMIPPTPATKLFRTQRFVQEEWEDILSKEEVVLNNDLTNTWLSLLLVNAAALDALNSLRQLKNVSLDDGLTRSWALYMAATQIGSDALVSTSQKEIGY